MTDYAPVSYWYPDLGAVDSRWQSVLDTRPPFALVNPNSGPGASVDAAYEDLCGRLDAAGIRTVGYVSTLWGDRAEATILSEIKTYRDRYGVKGVFFDECPNFWSSNQQGYIDKYTRLRDEIRSTYGSDFLIVHNPGTVPIEAMIPLADLHMSFESSATNYLTNADYFPEWLQAHAAKMWHVVYGVTEDNAQAVMDKAGQWASHIYLTDRGHDPTQVDGNNAPSTPENNPYLTPPAQWLLTLQQGQDGDTMRLIPGPILGYLGAKVDVARHRVDAAASVKRASLDYFEVPEGKTLLLTAVGTHGGNPWQTPSLQAAGTTSFPNFDPSDVAAGVEWTHGSVHTGPATVTLTVGNTSPWEDEANLTRFTGTVTALIVPSDQITDTTPVIPDEPEPEPGEPVVETRPVSLTGVTGSNVAHALTTLTIPEGQTWQVRIQGQITEASSSTIYFPFFRIGAVDGQAQGVGPVDVSGTVTSANPSVSLVTVNIGSRTDVSFTGTITITKP